MSGWRTVRAGIVERRFADPDEFLRELDGSSELWGDLPNAWIFRGHANASWALLPSAHRADSWAELTPPGVPPFMPAAATEQARLGKEQGVVQAFLEALDASGIHVPLEYRLLGGIPSGINEKPLALAQHYGLPTRLLDWTRQALVAAYFACLRPRGHAGDMAVWSLNAAFVNTQPTEHAACQIVQTTRSDNPNLHAQDSLFTYAGLARGTDVSETALPTIDDILSDIAAGVLPLRSGVPSIPHPIMRRFVLPRECDGALMRRLHQRRVSAGRVFPGLAGVAMTVRERLQFGVKDLEF